VLLKNVKNANVMLLVQVARYVVQEDVCNTCRWHLIWDLITPSVKCKNIPLTWCARILPSYYWAHHMVEPFARALFQVLYMHGR
jgi:hypothetical protein